MDKIIDNYLVTKLGQGLGENSSAFYYLHRYWEEPTDPRIRGYFMADISFIGFFSFIIFLYLFPVLILFPLFMRKAFDLKKLIIIYNIIMVLINAFFFFKVLFCVTCFGRRMWDFSNPKEDRSPTAQEFIRVAHLYYLSKMADLLDTFFMALKKKWSQISFLHIWHHVSLVSAGWMFLKYNPYMPTAPIVPIINGFIHVLMYSYYALSALGPKWRRFLWWKRYMTQMQLTQLTLVFFWFVIVFFKQTDLPPGYLLCMLGNALFLLLLFLHFYVMAYLKTNHQKSN